MVDQLKGENSRLQEALNHDPHGKLLGELHDEVVKVGKDVETHGKGLEGVINEGLQKISKQFPDLQSLEVHICLLNKCNPTYNIMWILQVVYIQHYKKQYVIHCFLYSMRIEH